jgi:hypothetical protein
MREIDFLPSWYPAIQRRYRWVIAQAWVTLVLIFVLSGYALAKHYQVRAARQTTAQTEAQIQLSHQQLAQLNEKLKYQDELRQQDRIVARLGLGVETTRVLKALQDAMSPAMALTGLKIETEEQPRAIALTSSLDRDQPLEMDRRLKVTVDGVAPTEIEAVTLLGNLLKVKCFENVAIQSNQGKMRDGHITHDFEVTFEINLNPTVEDKP